MSTCKECIHFEVCDRFTAPNETYPEVGGCKVFKPKADYVEVVFCKDCKHLYCCSAIDRQFYCRHYPHGLSGINIVEDNPFCSYGERKESEVQGE